MAKVETLRAPAADCTMPVALDPTRNYGLGGTQAIPTGCNGLVEPQQLQSSSGLQPAPPRPVKMKFSAIWDVNKIPTNCVPRLCRLNVTRLDLKSIAIQPDTTAVLLAVKIQGRRRTLRSSEIALLNTAASTSLVNSTGAGFASCVDVNLEFSLQYPHFLKRSNHIEIMLQRKKHYKNRTIPGYKTLAIGKIDMAEVLQRPMDDEQQLDLFAPIKLIDLPPVVSHIAGSGSDNKTSAQQAVASTPGTAMNADKSSSAAATSSLASSSSIHSNRHHHVLMASLKLSCAASQPLPKCSVPGGKGRDAAGFSDEDISSGVDDVITDSDDILAGAAGGDDEYAVSRRVNRHHHHHRAGDISGSASKVNSSNKKNFKSIALGQQTKFKQKIVSLLKKMKVSGAGASSNPSTAVAASDPHAADLEAVGGENDVDNIFPESLEDLEADLENWAPQSDSEGDGVSLAINTVVPAEMTPKPSLRPFFFSDIRLSSEQLPLLSDDLSAMGNASSSHTHADHKDVKGDSSTNPQRRAVEQDTQPAVHLVSPVKPVSLDPRSCPPGRSSYGGETLPRHLALSASCQVEHIFQTSTDMPNHIILVNDSVANLAKTCAAIPDGLNVVCVSSLPDVDIFFAEITRFLQKFSNAPCLAPLKIIVCGPSDAFFSSVTQSFVERFSSRLPDLTGIVRFLPVPLFAGSAVSQLLSAVNFNYRAFIETSDCSLETLLLRMAASLPLRPLDLFSIPIGEVLLTIRDKSSDNRSRQVVLPFICDIQVNIVRTSTLLSSSLTPQTGAGSSSAAATTVTQPHHATPPQPGGMEALASATSSAAWGQSGATDNALMMAAIQPPCQMGDTTAEFSVGLPHATNGVNSPATVTASSNITNASAWNATQLPNGPLSSASNASTVVATAATAAVPSSTVTNASSVANAAVLGAHSSPDITTASSSSSFEVNVDYWLDPQANQASLLSSSATVTASSTVSSMMLANNSNSISSSSNTNNKDLSSMSPMTVGPSNGGSGSSSVVMVSGRSSFPPLPGSGSNSSGNSSALPSSSTAGQLSNSTQQQQGGRAFNVRGSYRHMVITRSFNYSSFNNDCGSSNPSNPSSSQQQPLTIIMSARDKKIKKILLNRKSKESLSATTGDASKGQTIIEGISRLVCTVKSSSSGHKVVVCVDGVEFSGVKFFQISPAWHSHVKSFPIFTPQLAAMAPGVQYSYC